MYFQLHAITAGLLLHYAPCIDYHKDPLCQDPLCFSALTVLERLPIRDLNSLEISSSGKQTSYQTNHWTARHTAQDPTHPTVSTASKVLNNEYWTTYQQYLTLPCQHAYVEPV